MQDLSLRSRPRSWNLETLEARTLPAPLAPAPPLTINQRIVNFLEARMNVRIGGGECTHAATEALRVAGARFIRPADAPIAGDYVWGALVKVLRPGSDSAPSSHVRPGDIIQYRNVVFSNGMWATHHTAIVAAVDGSGRPTWVYEQNFNNVRAIQKNPIAVPLMVQGYMRIYRPLARPVIRGRTEFTIVNSVPGYRVASLRVGPYPLGSFSLGSVNTWDSYQSRYVTGPAIYRVFLTVGRTTIPVVNGGYYQLFVLGGRMSVRRIG